MIDLAAPIWIPFAVWAAAAFVLGAAFVADTRPSASLERGLVLGTVMTTVFVGCDLFRRFIVVGEGVSSGVLRLLLIAGVASIAFSGVSGYVASTLWRRRAACGRWSGGPHALGS